MRRYTRTLFTCGLLLAFFAMLRPAPASAQSPDTIAAAKEMMVVMKATDQYKAALSAIMPQIMKAVTASTDSQAKGILDAKMPELMQLMNARADEMIDKIASIYARNFTVQELRDVTAFYRTPAGQKLVERQPAMMQETVMISQQVSSNLVQELQKRMLEETSKK